MPLPPYALVVFDVDGTLADTWRLMGTAIADALHRLSGRRVSGVRLAIVSSNAEANARQVLGPDLAALVAHYACGASLFGKAARFRRVVRTADLLARCEPTHLFTTLDAMAETLGVG